MLILTSPAKSLDLKSNFVSHVVSQPIFLHKSEFLHKETSKLSEKELKELFGVSENLAKLNYQRIKSWNPKHNIENSRPAIFTYSGDVFRQLDFDKYDNNELVYLQKSLRILSGLYGILKPLDLIQAHRLEMGTKLNDIGKLDEFWKKDVTNFLNSENQNILNLASIEYANSINTEEIEHKFLDITFKQIRRGKAKSFGLLSKRARGIMIDYCAKNNVTDFEQLKTFKQNNYNFVEEESTEANFVFLQDEM